MQKGSKNRGKQRIRVARMHEKVAAQRRDFFTLNNRERLQMRMIASV